MRFLMKRMGVYAVCFSLVLTGCVTNQGGSGTAGAGGPSVGPSAVINF